MLRYVSSPHQTRTHYEKESGYFSLLNYQEIVMHLSPGYNVSHEQRSHTSGRSTPSLACYKHIIAGGYNRTQLITARGSSRPLSTHRKYGSTPLHWVISIVKVFQIPRPKTLSSNAHRSLLYWVFQGLWSGRFAVTLIQPSGLLHNGLA